MAIPTIPTLILQPFANSGDKTAPPQTDPSGFVNFSDGYTLDYEIDLNSTNPNAKAVERQVQNYLYNLGTSVNQFWQQLTVAPWYSTMPGGYNLGALVGRLTVGNVWRLYRSLVNANVVDPNTGGQTSWEYVPYNAEILSQVAMPAGGGGVVAPGGQVGEIITVATDLNTLLNGTWEFSSNSVANASPHAPAQLGGSTLAGMLQSKQWTFGGTTFVVQQYMDQSGNAFFRGASNGSFTAWRSITPIDTYSLDTGVANAVQGNALLSSTVIADNQRFWVKVAALNTGSTTFSPSPSVAALPVVGLNLTALTGGELVTNGRAQFLFDSANNRWILLGCSGASLQIAPATSLLHAAQLGQATGRLLRTLIYARVGGVQMLSVDGGAFTATGATTFTKLPFSTFCEATVQAAGGGGGGGVSSATQGAISGGGSGGATAIGRFAASALSGQTVTVGVGGVGGIANLTNGTQGGSSSIGALISSTGGGASSNASPTSPPAANGGGGLSAAPVGANLYGVRGGGGTFGLLLSGNVGVGGPGGGAYFGPGPTGPSAITSNGNDGINYGTGGSGCTSGIGNTGGATGGKGADGIVIIREMA